MPPNFIEDTVEQAALEWLRAIGYTTLHGPTIAPDQPASERATYSDVVLVGRLRAALLRLNPHLPTVAIEEALTRLRRTDSPNLFVNNHAFHRLLVEGVPVAYQHQGRTVYENARLVEYDPTKLFSHNDWLAVNQFSIRKLGTLASSQPYLDETRRPDIILFINGLPLGVIELKNTADEHASVSHAYQQLQTYKQEIPDLFIYNEALVISDGIDARLGTLTASQEWFKPWRSVDGEGLEQGRPQLEVLIRGVFAPHNFLDLIRYFTLYEQRRDQLIKKVAGYHQFFAANKAVAATLVAVQQSTDARNLAQKGAGVVWHYGIHKAAAKA